MSMTPEQAKKQVEQHLAEAREEMMKIPSTPCSAEEIFRQALLEICSTPDKGQLCVDAKWMKGRAKRALEQNVNS